MRNEAPLHAALFKQVARAALDISALMSCADVLLPCYPVTLLSPCYRPVAKVSTWRTWQRRGDFLARGEPLELEHTHPAWVPCNSGAHQQESCSLLPRMEANPRQLQAKVPQGADAGRRLHTDEGEDADGED